MLTLAYFYVMITLKMTKIKINLNWSAENGKQTQLQ